ncbi:OSBL1 protein, partial [Polypterus senegalus]
MNTTSEEQFLHDARNGNIDGIKKLLESRKCGEINFDINCKGRSKSNLGWTPLHLACYFGHKDVAEELLKAGAEVNVLNDMGDTPLHRAAYTGRKELVMLLLQYNACACVINGTAQTPKEVTRDKDIRSMLEAAEITEERKLEEFLLAAAREGATASVTELLNRTKPPNINCTDLQGNTPLHCAAYRGNKQCALKLLKSGADITIKNKNNQTPLDLALGTDMRQILMSNSLKKWIDAIEEHSAFSTHYCTQDQLSDDDDDDNQVSSEDLRDSLQMAIIPLFDFQFKDILKSLNLNVEGLPVTVLLKLKNLADLSTETCAALNKCLMLFTRQEGVQSVKLEQEQEKNKILSEALQTLATEHHELEQSIVKGSPPKSVLSEDEFYDALSDSDSEHSLSGFETVTSHSFEEETISCSRGHTNQITMSEENDHGREEPQSNGIKKYRTSLPAPMFSRNDFSIWSILRKCIGMELSKITMPVIFNEPLSFLQRLTEYMEHTYLIHKANASSNSIERMQCVAAFAVSAVASQWERTGKPFNPLLGETYELVREDLGFRLISEQVSHHPPVSAFHAEGLKNDFVFHGSIYPKLKFWGKSVEAEPKGIITLELLKHNESYTWTNPTCCVHNIIVGKLWIEQYGNVEITNHNKKKLCALYGKWTECFYTVDSAVFDEHKKNDKRNADEKKINKATTSSEEPDEMPMPDAETVQVIPGSRLLWRIAPRPPNSSQMYNFTGFTMNLNELDKEMEGVIPKTDCRLRPDIRAMENGNIDLASEEKKRLEEKQRAARKNRSKSDDEWKTSETEKKTTLDQAFRSVLEEEIVKQTASCEDFLGLIYRSIDGVTEGICSATTPFLLLGDVLDCLPLDQCDKIFTFVEENVSTWKSHIEEKDDNMEEGEMGDDETPTTSSIPIDYNLYRKFWTLQDYFRNPVQCYDKFSWMTFLKYSDETLAVFKSYKLDDTQASRKKLEELKTAGGEHIYFAKFLTSEKLLKEIPPDGDKFAAVVEHILNTEENWNAWKNEGCPSFVKERPVETKPIRPARKRPAPEDFLSKGPDRKVLMGNSEELTRLWNLNNDNMEACKSESREFMPSLEEFFEEAIEQADPANMVEEKYKVVNNSNYGWRALRLLARRSPHFFQPTNQQFKSLPEYLENMVIKLAKELPPPSEEIKTGEEDEDNDDTLLKENNESPDVQHHKSVTGQQIEAVANKLGDQWKVLARHMELKDVDIREIESDSDDVNMRAKLLLVLWQDREGNQATVGNLGLALNSAGFAEIAESLNDT